MWILFAFGSAAFAGLTAILAKMGLKEVDSDLATALRTIVVLVFAWLMAFLTGGIPNLAAIGGNTYLFLILSGLATGAGAAGAAGCSAPKGSSVREGVVGAGVLNNSDIETILLVY